jgi:putative transposase
LITPHAVYTALGHLPAERQAAYRATFATRSDAEMIDAIRSATKKGTVLGGTRFHEAIETVLRPRLRRLAHGGDRRSRTFR